MWSKERHRVCGRADTDIACLQVLFWAAQNHLVPSETVGRCGCQTIVCYRRHWRVNLSPATSQALQLACSTFNDDHSPTFRAYEYLWTLWTWVILLQCFIWILMVEPVKLRTTRDPTCEKMEINNAYDMRGMMLRGSSDAVLINVHCQHYYLLCRCTANLTC